MTTYVGKDGAVKLGGVTVGEVRDFSIEQSANRVDDTTMGDEWMTGKITQKSWTGSVNIYYDPNELTKLNSQLEAGTEISLELYPQGETTGNRYFKGNAHITGVSSSQSFDGMIEASFSVEGTGPLDYLTA